MKTIAAVTIATMAMTDPAGVGPTGSLGILLAQAKAEGFCVQVISCGTKNGKRKEYPTPCAAKDDGATDIAPKSGPSC